MNTSKVIFFGMALIAFAKNKIEDRELLKVNS